MAPNAIYVELLGNALLYSANYERRLSDGFAARVGFMYIGASGTDSETGEHVDVEFAVFPVMANFLLGEGAGRLELGIGPLFAFGSGEVEDIEGETEELDAFGPAGVTSTIGYRHHPVDGGLVFRAGLTPYWSGDPGIWGGVSIGWAF
jgi:hypothetical protein